MSMIPDPTFAEPVPPVVPQALAGLKVIELGQLIAGPFAGKTLADFGAEVIKIEPPASDTAASRCVNSSTKPMC
jgi:crotonobetainyl-CoA:carnitine CoA-transferase CaiB-like acyl-CoA transferase